MKFYTMSQILEDMPDAKIDDSLFSVELTLNRYEQYVLTIICAGRSRGFFLFLDKIGRKIVGCLGLLDVSDEVSLIDLQRIACRVVLVNDKIEGIGHITEDRFISFNVMDFFRDE